MTDNDQIEAYWNSASLPDVDDPSYVFRMLDISSLRPPRYLLKNMLYLNTLAQFFGPPESCKSLIALDVALSVSNGKDWGGLRGKGAQVFYIAGEGSEGLRKRARAWCDANDGTTENFFMLNTAADLLNAERCGELQQAIMAVREEEVPTLIVIDTVARNFGSGDENSTTDMNKFIAHVDKYLRCPFNACVILVHHSGVSDKHRGRGSSALKAAVDSEYRMSRKEGITKIECTKAKDFDRPAEMHFSVRGVVIEGEFDEDHEPITAPLLEPLKPHIEIKQIQNDDGIQASEEFIVETGISQVEQDSLWLNQSVKKYIETHTLNPDKSGTNGFHFMLKRDLRSGFSEYLAKVEQEAPLSTDAVRKRWERAIKHSGLFCDGFRIFRSEGEQQKWQRQQHTQPS